MAAESKPRAARDDSDLEPEDDDEARGDADADEEEEADDQSASRSSGAGASGAEAKQKPTETNEQRLQRELDEARAQKAAAERELRKQRKRAAAILEAAGGEADGDVDEQAKKVAAIQAKNEQFVTKIRTGQQREAVRAFLDDKYPDYATTPKIVGYIMSDLDLSEDDLDGDEYDKDALSLAVSRAVRDYVKANPRSNGKQKSGAEGGPERNNLGDQRGGSKELQEFQELDATYDNFFTKRMGVSGPLK